MSVRKLARDEIGDRGAAIYTSKLRPLLEPQCHGQFVAIDVETEDYEVSIDRIAKSCEPSSLASS